MRTLFITTTLVCGLAGCSLYSSDPSKNKPHPPSGVDAGITGDAPYQGYPDAHVIDDGGIIGDAGIWVDSGVIGDAAPWVDGGVVLPGDGGSCCNEDGGTVYYPDAAEWHFDAP